MRSYLPTRGIYKNSVHMNTIHAKQSKLDTLICIRPPKLLMRIAARHNVSPARLVRFILLNLCDEEEFFVEAAILLKNARKSS